MKHITYLLLAFASLLMTACDAHQDFPDTTIKPCHILCTDGKVVPYSQYEAENKQAIAVVFNTHKGENMEGTGYAVYLWDISINDRIDSKGVLFPETTVLDVLNIFGALPEEAAALRKASAHVEKLKTVVNTRTVTAETKAEREKNIVNMYNSGHSIDDIWKVSGFSSRSSVFRILNKFGVDLNRGKFKGPLGKRQSKE